MMNVMMTFKSVGAGDVTAPFWSFLEVNDDDDDDNDIDDNDDIDDDNDDASGSACAGTV